MMPILNPAGVQEIIDYALLGWAMSRYTGTWTALKCMHETVESTGVVDGSVDRLKDWIERASATDEEPARRG